jgi:glutamate--glyoxylate aminotransferase
MGEPYASRVELFSFHTVSKGALGECGLRGGYFEALNIHPDTIAELYKYASINICPNVFGQVAMSLMVNEPKPGQPSYEQFMEEKKGTLASYRCALSIVTRRHKGTLVLPLIVWSACTTGISQPL